jgi:anti-anti-sigma regulatory factor
MSMTVVLLKIDEERIVQALQETVDKLDSVEDELVLDFTSVRRIGSRALRGMEDFASTAENKGVRVVLCGVSIGVYKVLKLVNLSPRFSFVN